MVSGKCILYFKYIYNTYTYNYVFIYMYYGLLVFSEINNWIEFNLIELNYLSIWVYKYIKQKHKLS